MAVRGVLTVLGVLLLANGCGGEPEAGDGGTKARVCAPNTVYSCFRNGCKGHQTCASDGSSMSKCSCDPVEEDAGMVVRDAGEVRDHEICDNGRDDDGDGDIDCADDDCSDRSCHGAAPADWSGPISMRNSDGAAPSCEGAFGERVLEAGSQPSAAGAECSTCSCSPSGSACAAFVDFSTGSEAGCGGSSCTTSVNQSCSEIMPPCLTGQSSAYLGTKLASGSGTCSPSNQTPKLPDVKWTKRAALCRGPDAQRGGCEMGRVCVAKPSKDAKLCVYREGEHDCPAQMYTHRELYYRDVDDTRSCSACKCSGPNCSYTWSVFNAADTSCQSPIIKLTSAGQCVQVNPNADKLRVGATIEGDGACSASGGESSGGVSGSEPVTVCCET